MKRSVAMKWVEALRSGKYKQGTSNLQGGDKYCCLGVLCDLAPKKSIDSRGVIKGVSLKCQTEVAKWSGINSDYGFVEGDHLSSLNDRGIENTGEPLTFDEIADIIQICWREL